MGRLGRRGGKRRGVGRRRLVNDMVIRIVRNIEFSAAHRIEGHPKCGDTHGHNYMLTVKFDISGFVDFHDLQDIVLYVVDSYDHVDLGHCTCEDLAQRIKEEVIQTFHRVFTQRKLYHVEVELYETAEFGVIC